MGEHRRRRDRPRKRSRNRAWSRMQSSPINFLDLDGNAVAAFERPPMLESLSGEDTLGLSKIASISVPGGVADRPKVHFLKSGPSWHSRRARSFSTACV